MSDSRILPGARARLVDDRGVTAREFYDFFRRLEQVGVDSAQIEELASKLGSPDGTIANIPPITSQQLSGQFPIQVNGAAVSFNQVSPALSGDLQGFGVDAWGRVTASRPVVAGAGITIDGTTDPDQIEIIAAGLSNPMTTLGDIIKGGASGVPERLGIGAEGEVLTVVSGAPAWAAGGGGGSSAPKWKGEHRVVALGSAVNTVGMSTVVLTGSATFAAMSTASVFASRPRRNQNATASATAVVGVRGSGGVFLFRSTGAGIGGFKCSMELGVGTGGTVASHRFIMGLSNTTGAPTDVEPSSRLNFIGLGYDSGDAQVQIMHNDGSGTATKVALGAGFLKPSAADTFVFQLTLENATGSGDVDYSVVELSTGNTASGTLTTDLPTVGLDFYTAMSAGGTSTAINQTFSWFTVEI